MSSMAMTSTLQRCEHLPHHSTTCFDAPRETRIIDTSQCLEFDTIPQLERSRSSSSSSNTSDCSSSSSSLLFVDRMIENAKAITFLIGLCSLMRVNSKKTTTTADTTDMTAKLNQTRFLELQSIIFAKCPIYECGSGNASEEPDLIHLRIYNQDDHLCCFGEQQQEQQQNLYQPGPCARFLKLICDYHYQQSAQTISQSSSSSLSSSCSSSSSFSSDVHHYIYFLINHLQDRIHRFTYESSTTFLVESAICIFENNKLAKDVCLDVLILTYWKVRVFKDIIVELTALIETVSMVTFVAPWMLPHLIQMKDAFEWDMFNRVSIKYLDVWIDISKVLLS